MNQVLGKGKTTAAEGFWYVVMNFAFFAAYFAKIPVKKALEEYGQVQQLTTWENIWYVLMNISFGSGYFAKVVVKKAMSEVRY